MTRVLLIGDDDVDRAGFELIVRSGGHHVVPARWSDLRRGADPPHGIERVLAQLRPDPTAWDRYHVLPGLHRLHLELGPGTPIIGIVETCAPTNPLLMLRMHHAGISRVVRREELADASAILATVDGESCPGASPEPSPLALAELGIGRRTDPTRAIAELVRLGRIDDTYLRAFTPGLRQNESGLSRRRTHTLRVKLAEIGDLAASPRFETAGSTIDPALPRWSSVATYVNVARGAVAACGHGVDELRSLQTLAT